jgi:hypothetical protein
LVVDATIETMGTTMPLISVRRHTKPKRHTYTK